MKTYDELKDELESAMRVEKSKKQSQLSLLHIEVDDDVIVKIKAHFFGQGYNILCTKNKKVQRYNIMLAWIN